MRRFRAAIVAGGLCASLAACGDSPVQENPIVWREFAVVERADGFYPTALVVPSKEHVRVHFRSEHGGLHRVQLEPYRARSGSFTDDRIGVLEFYSTHEGEFTYRCTVWNGRAHRGMTGTISVMPAEGNK